MFLTSTHHPTTSVFFFFQAEDGIRDGTVTGVQTCALPISGRQRWPPATCTGQGQKSTGGECGARRPRYKAKAPNHRDRWRGTSASADPIGPDDSRAHDAT